MGFDVEAPGESREGSRGSHHAMARRHNGHGISAVCRTDGANGARIPDLFRNLTVRSRLSKRDRQQGVPHPALKGRPGDIQRQRELFPPSGKVLLELPLGLDEHRMVAVLGPDVQPHAMRPIVFPQDRGKAVVGRHQREPADGRRYVFVGHCMLRVFDAFVPFAVMTVSR
jgi:hypothetical protein